MLALTLTAPWGSAIMMTKWLENRNWAPPAWLIGKRIAIHQGKTVDEDALRDVLKLISGFPEHGHPLGAFLGTVVLYGYLHVDQSAGGRWRWYGPRANEAQVRRVLSSVWRNPEASHLWILKDPRSLAEPIPCRGMQKLWHVPKEHVSALEGLVAA